MAGAMIDLIHCVSVSIGTTHEWSNKVNKKKRQDVDELLFSLFFSPIYQFKKKVKQNKNVITIDIHRICARYSATADEQH